MRLIDYLSFSWRLSRDWDCLRPYRINFGSPEILKLSQSSLLLPDSDSASGALILETSLMRWDQWTEAAVSLRGNSYSLVLEPAKRGASVHM